MSTRAIEASHDIHTATNDVLKGYLELRARAEPEIQTVIGRLTAMHQQHASEQESEHLRLRDSGNNDSSLQGTMNKIVIVVRDWVSDLDRDVLPAVRMGEESLSDKYSQALDDAQMKDYPSVVATLRRQLESIGKEIARLPKE